jgi:hypothetical protein
VFADDVGAGFAKRVTAEYLSIRAEYGKLIKIDCLGPETIVPLTKFTGVDISRDRAAGTVTLSSLAPSLCAPTSSPRRPTS